MVGTYCCIPGCKSNSVRSKNNGIAVNFHYFPTEPKIRQLWVRAINGYVSRLRYKLSEFSRIPIIFSPKKNHRICGKHFVNGRRTFDDPVPSIFSPTKDTVKRRLIMNPDVDSLPQTPKSCRTPFKELRFSPASSINASSPKSSCTIPSFENQELDIAINDNELLDNAGEICTAVSNDSNESGMGISMNNEANMGTSVCDESAIKTLFSNETTVGTSISDKTTMGTSISNETTMGTSISNETTMGTSISNETTMGTSISNDSVPVPMFINHTGTSGSVLDDNQQRLVKKDLFLSESQVWNEKYKELHREIKELQSSLERVKIEKDHLQCLLNESRFCFEHLNEEQLKFYTGLDKDTFEALFELLEEDAEKLIYWKSTTKVNKLKQRSGKPRALSLRNELLLVLMRLRQGLLATDLAYRFEISVSTVSRIFITWIDFLDNRLNQLPIWPNKDFVKRTMPTCFQDNYPDTRVILDCTEIFVDTPSCFRVQAETYSTYKSHNTAKGLIGVSPAGLISFISHLAPGRLSDRELTNRSGLIELLEEGDCVMADKGFLIEDLLSEKKVSLNIPPFLRGSDQLTREQEVETRKIASLRIHVERTIRRVKSFRILKFVVPATMTPDLNKIWRVCCHLVNITSDPVTAKEESAKS